MKVAVPCDEHRNPVPDNALFHEKTGIIEDRGGDRIAWTGSLNETAAGWRRNWKTINVFKSRGPERDRVDHARRCGADGQKEGGPNALLSLMRALKDRTQGLVLLTATPMQVHMVKLWDLLDLLDLLGLPREWTAPAFLKFFDDVSHPNPSADAMERMARLFRATEHDHGPMPAETVQRMTKLPKLRARKVIQALRDPSSIPRRRLENEKRRAAVGLMRAYTPLRHLVSRHTRELLRRYAPDPT